ncbi:MAG TPA: RhuM family protein, partial [Candidatus Absconditabacterales bacterium]|nr:RhuM family protein [Candidatus Absconditabacterales bacterium]
MNKKQTGEIMIYKAKGGGAQIDVKLKNETIWLNLNQIADLFGRDKSVISRHMKNIYETQELKRDQTVAFFATVQKEGKKSVERQIEYFNLDTIISVGYRVNSKNATNFRIWATGVLKNHLVQGYSINQKRLSETGLNEFEKAIALIKRNIENNLLDDKEIKGMLSLVTNYAHSWIILQKYDEGTLSLENLKIMKTSKLEYKDA